MQIIPAIDIRKGKCVRLIQGDVRDETVYSKEPVEIAKLWKAKGAPLIHVVDIDGALSGKPKNMDIILKIVKSINNIKIEVGGGIRTEEDIEKYLNSGVKRVVLSTSIIQSERFFEKVMSKYKDKIIIGVDVKDGYIAAKGWKDITQIKVLDFIKKLEEKNVKRIIYTDINRDGVLKGPNFKGIRQVVSNTKMKVIVSGGITKLKNIERIMKLNEKYQNIEGIIIGKALYAETIDLKEAIKFVKEF